MFDEDGLSSLKGFQTMNREFGEMLEKKLRAKSTYNKYLTVYKHLEAFMWEKRKRTDRAYKELTKDFIDDFVFPMPDNGTCNDYLKKIAAACNINKDVTFHLAGHMRDTAAKPRKAESSL